MENPSNYMYIRVTKTYGVSAEQAAEALRVARAAAADTTYHTLAPDGTELTYEGDDYLRPDGSPDIGSALADIDCPVAVLGVEECVVESHVLSHEEAQETLYL